MCVIKEALTSALNGIIIWCSLTLVEWSLRLRLTTLVESGKAKLNQRTLSTPLMAASSIGTSKASGVYDVSKLIWSLLGDWRLLQIKTISTTYTASQKNFQQHDFQSYKFRWNSTSCRWYRKPRYYANVDCSSEQKWNCLCHQHVQME